MVGLKNISMFRAKSSSKVEIFNENEEEAQEYKDGIIHYGIMLLRMNCLWPRANQSAFSFRIQIVITLLLCSTTGFTNFTFLVHTFWSGDNYVIDDILEAVVISLTTIGIYTIMITLIGQSKVIMQLLKDINTFGEFGKPSNFDETNAKMNRFILISYLYAFGAVMLYVIFSFLDFQKCEARNVKYDINRLCGFITSFWVPFSMDPVITKVLFYIIQVTSSVVVSSAGTTIMGWIWAIVEMFLTKVANLKAMLLQINDLTGNGKKRAHMNKCIRYHIEIINLADQINECIGVLVFIASGLISMIIGMCAALFLLKPEVYTFIHGLGWVFGMYILCHTGQRLMDESTDIPFAVYDTEWFENDIGVQKDCIFFIMRGNAPLKLEAAGFFVVTMATFTGVMKNAYSFIALVQQTLLAKED